MVLTGVKFIQNVKFFFVLPDNQQPMFFLFFYLLKSNTLLFLMYYYFTVLRFSGSICLKFPGNVRVNTLENQCKRLMFGSFSFELYYIITASSFHVDFLIISPCIYVSVAKCLCFLSLL